MTKSVPAVSVVIPTHNRAHLIKRSLQSALDQTFRDIEVIVVDDGSTDDTQEVLATFDDPRMRVVSLSPNGGHAHARNQGIVAATGKYVAFLDSDDEWVPDKLEVQMRRFQEEDAPIAVYSGLFIDDGKTRRDAVASVEGRAFERFLALPGPITTTGLIVDGEVAGNELHFDETLGCAVEGDLLIRLSRNHSIGRVAQPLYVWYHHDGPHVAQDRCYAVARLKIIQKYWSDLEARPQLAAYCYFRLALTQRKVGNYAGARRSIWKAARLNPGDARLRVLDVIGGVGQTPLRIALGAYARAGRFRDIRETRRAKAEPALIATQAEART